MTSGLEPFATNRVENLVTLSLGAIVAAAASFSTPVVLPARQIAGAGLIPHDCEQVYATVLTVSTGTPEASGISGAGTWPTTGSGANETLYSATVTLAIVRNSNEVMTGLGNTPPSPAAYLANLAAASADMAVLMAAVAQIAEAQMSATPRTETAGNPLGGLVATTCRITVLV